MLLPRFTIRTLLAILTAAAVVFVMVGTAFRGQYWAWGVTIAIISCIVTALSHMAWFGIVWFFARMPESRGAAPAAATPAPDVSASISDSAKKPTGQVADSPASET